MALAADDGSRVFSAAASRRHEVLPRLFLGYGARASLLSGRVELYPVRIDGAPDRLVVPDAVTAMVNASIHAALRVTKPLELGFNLDIAGASAGASGTASYKSSPSAAPVAVGARPTHGNLFLFGSRDLGSLNSEFYASWRASPALSFRAGLSHVLVEYRVDRELGGTRLYRRFANMVLIGVRWTP